MANISTTVFSWIKGEIDHALKSVRDVVSRYAAAPDDVAALNACPVQLHQVSGALKVVGLEGATRFCETLEKTFYELTVHRGSRNALGVIDGALGALKEFLDDIARGQADVPMRLYPAYRELSMLRGLPNVSDKDLFFPDLTLPAPEDPYQTTLSSNELALFLQAQRARFQRGLLGALRSQPDGLHEMRQSCDAFHRVAGQLPEPRALWWVGIGLIDGMLHSPDSAWLAGATALCKKMDFLMRDLASGSEQSSEASLREALYLIAKCKPVSERIREIKQHYQLDALFPEPAIPGDMEFDLDWLEPALKDLHSRLEALKEVWVQYISGESKSVLRFRELIASFHARAVDVGNYHLVRLVDVIALVASRLPDPYPPRNQFMVIEMASAFLLAESINENFTSAPPDLEQQIVIMGGWLLDAAKGNSTGKPPPGLRADLIQQIGVLQVRAQVVREIQANLQHVEQVLDAFARDPGKRASLEGLTPYLRQILGALQVLEFERAAEVLFICDRMIAECARADDADTTKTMDWIAEGLSTLGFYLDPCLHGREPAGQSLTLFFSRLQARNADAATQRTVTRPAAPAMEADTAPDLAAPAPETVHATAGMEAGADPAPPPVAAVPEYPDEEELPPIVLEEAELLAIFLDEAGTLLAEIGDALQALRGEPESRDALATIRRGFHTLKGSGRMVDLTEVTEVAWEIELVLNQWLERRAPATPDLLELINWASASFASWIAQLRARRPLTIDARELVGLARLVRDNQDIVASLADLAATQAALVPAPEPTETPAVPTPDPEEVTIGGRRLKRDFLEIYLTEATRHVTALQTEFDSWRRTPGADTTHEFLRAAHTLASSSRTAGFTTIADLAGAIEHWMPFARQVSATGDAQAVQQGIGRLGEMVEAVVQRQPPVPADEAVARVQELTARLQASPPPPVESLAPAVAGLAPAVSVSAFPRGRDLRVLRDDIDEQLLPVFLEEAQALVPLVGSDMRALKTHPTDQKIWQSLSRALHTLKGTARMAGAIRLGELTHIMESRVEAAIDAKHYPADLFEDLQTKMDRMSLDLDRIRARRAASVAPPETAAAPVALPPEAPARAEPPLPAPAAMLRIHADTLDHLINESGEVAIARSRAETELRAIKQALADLNDSIARLRSQLREVEIQTDSQMQSRSSVLEERNREFDPLEFDRYTRLQELTRLMAESLHDAASIQRGMLKNLGDADGALLQQARASRDVQQELMRMRAAPFSNLNERLYRIVRQSARELDKKAELEIEDSRVELDRSVLETIAAPLEHMLRNAVAHGLEAPAARAAAGKPETGRITIVLRQESNEIALILSDDGAGLDLQKLQRKALDKGLLSREQDVTDAELMQLIFTSGLTTSDEVTKLAGRGVGMDVVRNAISSINGRVDLATVRGRGTTFTIYLPLTLAVTQAVLVRGGGNVFAVSSAMVERVLRLKSDAMAELYERRVIEFQDRTYPLHYLRYLLGAGGATEIQNYNSVLLLRSGIQRIAVHVDELIGTQEIVVKNIGPQLARVPGVVGATVLADGGIALIMNPVQLAQRARSAAAPAPAPEPARPSTPLILVVDDSLTVRKITSRLLEREGYQVLTAKDGVDALQQIRDTVPAVILVDIEMPRMDGFELTKALRGDPRTRGIPIIVISSRTADKHRSQAEQLGVNAFLGKPYQENQLLQHVATYLGVAEKARSYH